MSGSSDHMFWVNKHSLSFYQILNRALVILGSSGNMPKVN